MDVVRVHVHVHACHTPGAWMDVVHVHRATPLMLAAIGTSIGAGGARVIALLP